MPHAKPLSVAIALLLSTAALAQTTPTDSAEAEAALDEVVVTGSNLRGVDLAEAQPVQVIDAKQIERLGLSSLGDVLQLVSETGGGTGNFNTASSGALQADSPAGMAGASLRGLGAGSTLTLVNGRRVTASSFSNGVRSENFVDINALPMAAIERIEVLTADAYQRNGFYNRDRAVTARARGSRDGGAEFVSFNFRNFFSPTDFVEASCPADRRFDGRTGFALGRFGQYCDFEASDYTAFDPELKAIGAYGSFFAKLGDSLEYFGEAQLQRNESFANSTPASYPGAGLRIAFNHPNFPAELRARMSAAGLGASEDILGVGRFPDARRIDITTRNWRLLSGLRGSFGNWSWESAVSYGRSESEQFASGGIYNRARVTAGLRGRLCADGTTTCTPTTGGLWYNPFGGQSVQDPNVLALVLEEVPRDGESTSYGGDFKLNGFAGQIADRDIAWAFGIEARRDRIADLPSPLAEVDRLTGQPGVFGFGSKSARASRTASAAYAEALLPVTELLDVRMAARYDHYSDFGGDFNPSVDFRFRPNEALVFRGGWNTGFRAPSLAQAGAGTTAASFTLPCTAGSEFFANFCGSRAGSPTILSQVLANPDLQPETSTAWNLGAVWSPTDRTTFNLDYWDFDQENLVDVDYLSLLRRALANPSLIYTFADGARPRPIDAEGIELGAGTVGRLSTGEVFARLGNIGLQRTTGVDLGARHRISDDLFGGTLGLSLDATRVTSFERSESCSTSVAPVRGEGACVDGLRLIELNGEYRYPKWRGTLALDWTGEAMDVSLWARYVDSYYDDFRIDAEATPETRVSSWTTLNASWGWNIDEVHRVSINVDNLFDRDPPLALASRAGVDTFNHSAMGRYVTLKWIGVF